MSRLNPRKAYILNVLVRDYIDTGEPVGSRTISKKYLNNLSPATIRNVLSSLTADGYIHNPHTSSGRVPTDKGYRFYVNSLSSLAPTENEKEFIKSCFPRGQVGVEKTLHASIGALAELTDKAGIVLSPKLNKMVLNRIELIRVLRTHILVVLVGAPGDVFSRHIQLEEELTQEKLNSISRFLNDKYSGLTIPAIRKKIVAEMARDKKRYDTLITRAMDICSKFFKETKPVEELRFMGTENLFNQTEFKEDIASMREAFRALEDRAALTIILDKCLESDCPGVFIGSETGRDEISDCAVIARGYRCGNLTLGTIGIFGHKRMEYPRIIAIVDYTAGFLTRRLSESAGI